MESNASVITASVRTPSSSRSSSLCPSAYFRTCNYYSSCASRLAAFDSCILMIMRASLRNRRLCAQWWRSRPVFMFIHDDDARNLNKQSSAKKIREKQLNDDRLNSSESGKLQLRTARGLQIIHPITFCSPSRHLMIVGQLINDVAKRSLGVKPPFGCPKFFNECLCIFHFGTPWLLGYKM